VAVEVEVVVLAVVAVEIEVVVAVVVVGAGVTKLWIKTGPKPRLPSTRLVATTILIGVHVLGSALKALAGSSSTCKDSMAGYAHLVAPTLLECAFGMPSYEEEAMPSLLRNISTEVLRMPEQAVPPTPAVS